MAVDFGRTPGPFGPGSSPADEDDLGLLSDTDDVLFAPSNTIGLGGPHRSSQSVTPYSQPASAGPSRASNPYASEHGSLPSPASSGLSGRDATPRPTRASSTVSNNLHVQVSRLTQQFLATEDVVTSFDERLSKVERMPELFEEMLDGMVDKLRSGGNDDVLDDLKEALGEVRTAVADLREEVADTRDMREAIRQLQGEVEELKQGRQRYGKEKERAENGLAEERAREMEFERARDELRAAERAEETRRNNELRAKVIAMDKQYAAMAEAFVALKADYEVKNGQLVRKTAAGPALDVRSPYGNADRLDDDLPCATGQTPFSVGRHAGLCRSPSLATTDPMRYLNIPPSDSGDVIPDLPLFDTTDTAEVFIETRGSVLEEPLESTQYVDDGGFEYYAADTRPMEAGRATDKSVCPRSASEDRVEAEASLEPQAIHSGPGDMSFSNGDVGDDFGDAYADTFAMPDAAAAAEEAGQGETSDSSNHRLQTPVTADIEDDEASDTERAGLQRSNQEPESKTRNVRKRRAPLSQYSMSEEDDSVRKRLRASRDASQRAPPTASEDAHAHIVTSVHVSASRRPRPLKKKPPPKRRSQGLRKDVVPKWRMHIQALAVSDGTRRGTAEWPPKVEYTVKGRAQEIICDVCKGRAHWFCAGFRDDDPAPEGEWHCPDCAEKLESGTGFEPADGRAKVRTVRKEGDQEEWYPERIIGRKAIKRVEGSDARVFEYLIKWADWDIVWSTWEPVANFSTQKYMIDDFLRECLEQGVRTKPRVNLLPEAAKYYDAETTQLKPEYAADSDDEEGLAA